MLQNQTNESGCYYYLLKIEIRGENFESWNYRRRFDGGE